MSRPRYTAILPVLFIAVLLAGCSDLYCDPDSSVFCDDEEECTPAPSNCLAAAPALNRIQLEVSNPRPVLVKVYRGADYETATEIWSGVAPLATWSISAASGAYSATALYVRNGDSVLVVDGDILEAYAVETCDGSCFTEGSVALDLRLQ